MITIVDNETLEWLPAAESPVVSGAQRVPANFALFSKHILSHFGQLP